MFTVHRRPFCSIALYLYSVASWVLILKSARFTFTETLEAMRGISSLHDTSKAAICVISIPSLCGLVSLSYHFGVFFGICTLQLFFHNSDSRSSACPPTTSADIRRTMTSYLRAELGFKVEPKMLTALSGNKTLFGVIIGLLDDSVSSIPRRPNCR